MENRKRYEMVKYRYGKSLIYTAFCLTPATKHTVREIAGRVYTSTNMGKASPQAQHFERPWTAVEWAVRNHAVVLNPDFSLL